MCNLYSNIKFYPTDHKLNQAFAYEIILYSKNPKGYTHLE